MIRFLLASFLLHLLLYVVVTYKSVEVIEDPIVSVTLLENENESRKATDPKPKPVPKPISANTQIQNTPPEPAPEVSNENPNSSQSGTDESATGAGNVSVKPRVLRSFKASYPEAAKTARVEGPVRLSVLINSQGFVQEAQVLEGPGYGLNETAQEALKKFVFSPAEKDGIKVAVRIVYVYRFRLESR